jgi:TRAP-type mannitol/chloroaromatic compound transport system permease large subunit
MYRVAWRGPAHRILIHYPAANTPSNPRLEDDMSNVRTSTGTVFRGVMPFMWADVLRLAILVAFPVISLWLPRMMG